MKGGMRHSHDAIIHNDIAVTEVNTMIFQLPANDIGRDDVTISADYFRSEENEEHIIDQKHSQATT